MLLKYLQKIMDLPSHLALDEARKKLSETWMILNNDELVFVQCIFEDHIEVSYSNDGTYDCIDEKEIESLEVFLPEPGMYFVGNKWIQLYKTAKKQWRKSFNWDLYCCSTGYSINPSFFFKTNPVEFYIYKNKLYYYTIKIGNVKGLEIVLEDPRFLQEIADLQRKDMVWKLYQLSTAFLNTNETNYTKDLKVVKLPHHPLHW